MSKITIVSRPDQHLLIDISGCLSFKETIEQLSTSLLSANHFWQGTTVDLNLGNLLLSKPQLAQILALTKGVGIYAKHILAENPETVRCLKELAVLLEIAINNEEPAQLSSVAVLPDDNECEHIKTIDPEYNANMQAQATIDQMLVFADNATNTAAEDSVPAGCEMITCTDSLAANHQPADQRQDSDASKRQSLYIKQTLRAGQAVSHKGDLIIIGDVNAGAEVLAEGDITIWGSLRGIAHAGVGGNTMAEIRALRLQPIQLRIAHYIARSPDAILTANSILSASPFMAETAKLVNGKIRILRETFD